MLRKSNPPPPPNPPVEPHPLIDDTPAPSRVRQRRSIARVASGGVETKEKRNETIIGAAYLHNWDRSGGGETSMLCPA